MLPTPAVSLFFYLCTPSVIMPRSHVLYNLLFLVQVQARILDDKRCFAAAMMDTLQQSPCVCMSAAGRALCFTTSTGTKASEFGTFDACRFPQPYNKVEQDVVVSSNRTSIRTS